MQRYVTKYFTPQYEGFAILAIKSGVGYGGGSAPFRSGGFGWGRASKTADNFQMRDGNGFGNGAYVYSRLDLFDCRLFNFWEIEITSK